MNKFIRTQKLVSDEKFELLTQKKVLICGIGGVGGAVFLGLLRSGINNITIIDFDRFDESNLNRQLLSSVDSIGKEKVFVAKEIALNINPDAQISALNFKISEETIKLLELYYDYIIDCIDDTKAKVLLYRFAFNNNINIISSMGTAMKFDPLKLKVGTINQTSYDPLAKQLRYMLKDEKELLKTNVVYSTEEVTKDLKKLKEQYGFLPSNVIVPNSCGLLIVKEVLLTFLN